jgi:pyrroline-5-carboxylate reductase
LGFTKAEARVLAYTTFAGTMKLASSSQLEPAILRAQVTSKGGTTERAMGMLEADAVKARFVAAVKAAAARAKEMGDALGAEGQASS